jgi:hypothetical protein
VKHRPREDAYGPSPIDSSTRHAKQIDLWTGMERIDAVLWCTEQLTDISNKIKVDRWRVTV